MVARMTTDAKLLADEVEQWLDQTDAPFDDEEIKVIVKALRGELYVSREVDMLGGLLRLDASRQILGSVVGITVHSNPDLPEGTAQIRDRHTGRVLLTIVNIGSDISSRSES